MNYEINLLHHVGLVAKRVRAAAAAAETAAHEGDDNTPSGPTGRGKNLFLLFQSFISVITHAISPASKCHDENISNDKK